MAKDLHPDDVVRLATALHPMQAHIWEQALNSEGIPCNVVGDYLEAGLGEISGPSAEIWVHKDDLARAEEILRQGQAAHEEVEEEERDESEPEG